MVRVRNHMAWKVESLYLLMTHKKEDDIYHLFVNTVCANKTTMHDKNAVIIHAVAKDIMGPYRYFDTALGPATTNPHIVKAPEGGYLIFNTLDNPSDDWVPCTGERDLDESLSNGVIPHSINVAYSKYLTGPWKRYALEVEMGPYGIYYNPAVYIFENGTVLMVLTGYLGDNCSGVYCEKLVMLKAYDWRGPYKLVNPLIFEHSGEDAFLWKDKRGFKMLFHNFQTPGWNIDSTLVGGYAYSLDGITWTRSEEMAFYTTVPMITGGSKTYTRRERPEIYFEDGVPKYLLTACQAVFELDHPSTFNIVPILTD